jgi:hypothetical protein
MVPTVTTSTMIPPATVVAAAVITIPSSVMAIGVTVIAPKTKRKRYCGIRIPVVRIIVRV